MTTYRFLVPASFFGMVLGLVGLGSGSTGSSPNALNGYTAVALALPPEKSRIIY